MSIVNVIEAFLHDVDQGEVEFEELNNVLGFNELKKLVELAKQGEELPVSEGVKVGSKIKITKTTDNPDDGKLPDEIIGQIVTVRKLIDSQIWVDFDYSDILILEGEYEIVE